MPLQGPYGLKEKLCSSISPLYHNTSLTGIITSALSPSQDSQTIWVPFCLLSSCSPSVGWGTLCASSSLFSGLVGFAPLFQSSSGLGTLCTLLSSLLWPGMHYSLGLYPHSAPSLALFTLPWAGEPISSIKQKPCVCINPFFPAPGNIH